MRQPRSGIFIVAVANRSIDFSPNLSYRGLKREGRLQSAERAVPTSSNT